MRRCIEADACVWCANVDAQPRRLTSALAIALCDDCDSRYHRATHRNKTQDAMLETLSRLADWALLANVLDALGTLPKPEAQPKQPDPSERRARLATKIDALERKIATQGTPAYPDQRKRLTDWREQLTDLDASADAQAEPS